MSAPRLAGIREPGLRKAGQQSSTGGGGGGGGATDAGSITIVDAGNHYASGFVEGALQEAYTAVLARVTTADLASTASGKGASLIGTNDPSLLIGGLHPTVEASLVSIADDADTALSQTIPLTRGGTGQITAAASFDALTVTAPAIASAATIDLSLAGCPGHYVIINGATGPITSFGTAPAGTERILRFASNPTITHNAASLILPGGASITMAAGDVLFVHSLGAGNWRATSYTRGASLPAYAADLALAGTAGKGSDLVGVRDAGGYFTSGGWTTVDLALQFTYARAAAAPTSVTLADTATGKGASLIGIEDAANLIAATTVEGVFTAQAAGSFVFAKLKGTTSDATLTTADLITLRHATSATVLAGSALGVRQVVELQNTAGAFPTAGADTTSWTTATSGSETSQRIISLANAGALVSVVALSPNSAGSLSTGTLTLTDSGSYCGLLLKAAGAGVLGGFRVRNGPPGLEYFASSGHTFYGDMTGSTKVLQVGPTASGIAFFGATQVTQQSTTGTTTGFTAGGGTAVTDASTFTGGVGATAYRISDVVRALKNYGLLAA